MLTKKELWKELRISGKRPSVPYVISNHGRFGVLKEKEVQLRTIKPSKGGYRYNIRQNGKSIAIFIYKEVAKAFLKKPSPKHLRVIHKDHNYLNNHVTNLVWATLSEHRLHTLQSPESKKARLARVVSGGNRSKILSEKEVIALKRMIWDPKRKLSYSSIAKKFGVSEMQIYRIKNGIFWYHIKVEHEPVSKSFKKNQQNLLFRKQQLAKKKALTKNNKRKK